MALSVFYLTAPFNNMRTLKFKAQPTYAFVAAVNQNRWARFRQRTGFGGSRKLGGPSEHLIDGTEKHICRLSFLF